MFCDLGEFGAIPVACANFLHFGDLSLYCVYKFWEHIVAHFNFYILMQTMVVFSVDSNLRLRMHPSS
jgi:hypothetical protein